MIRVRITIALAALVVIFTVGGALDLARMLVYVTLAWCGACAAWAFLVGAQERIDGVNEPGGK